MTIYAVTAGFHDTSYLKYFVNEKAAEKYKAECENAPSREDWEDKPEVVEAKKEWLNYRDYLNRKYLKKNIVDLSPEIKKKWGDLLKLWQYNSHWGHPQYYIYPIEVVE